VLGGLNEDLGMTGERRGGEQATKQREPREPARDPREKAYCCQRSVDYC
jgi:hypothetical protein